MRRLAGAAVIPSLLGLVLSGCLASSPPAAMNAPMVAAAELALAPARAAIANCAGCAEPTVATDAAGRIFAVAFNSGGIAVSDDEGISWSLRRVPSPPPGPFRDSYPVGDDHIQVAPWGTLYFSRLWSNGYREGVAGGWVQEGIAGVQVAVSPDGGLTWPTNVYLDLRNNPKALGTGYDRQWLAFDGDSIVHLVFNGGYSLVTWSMTSRNRGATWSDPVPVATLAEGRYPAPVGMPFVAPDHTLVVPFYADWNPVVLAGTIMVAYSTDEGASFRHAKAYSRALSGGRSGGAWPEGTALPNGTWVVAWRMSDGLWFAYGADHGATWNTRRVPLTDTGDGFAPWVEGRADGSFDAVWNAGPSMWLGRMSSDGTFQEVAVSDVATGPTHFPHFAHMMDGRAVVVWLKRDGPLQMALTNS